MAKAGMAEMKALKEESGYDAEVKRKQKEAKKKMKDKKKAAKEAMVSETDP